MPELMKYKINEQSLYELATRINQIDPSFAVRAFVSDGLREPWETLPLKARIRKIALTLGQSLPQDYRRAVSILSQVAAGYPPTVNGLSLLCLPDFVEVFGQKEADWDISMAALEQMTPIATGEFAVRAFILNDEPRMMRQMERWTQHPSEHVRRLASEGCRPLLPWGQVLNCFRQDPLPVLKILELLKADPAPYVQKSVANNLNDLSKTHPELVLQTAYRWYGENEITNWIVKHGCRTLLKTGNAQALALFGLADQESVKVADFRLSSASIQLGEDLNFSFQIEAHKAVKVRLEYAIDYVRASGKRSRKIFKISELTIKEKEKRTYARKHSFADTSVRKHVPGRHSITLIVNGAKLKTLDFEVMAAVM